MNRIFCISREPHGHEDWKSDMVERLYGIPVSHCFYTLEAKEKPQIVIQKVNELFPVEGDVKRLLEKIGPERVIWRYDTKSPILCDKIKEDETIKDAGEMKSFLIKDEQMSLFDYMNESAAD